MTGRGFTPPDTVEQTKDGADLGRKILAWMKISDVLANPVGSPEQRLSIRGAQHWAEIARP